MILHYYHHLFSFLTDIYEQLLAPLDIRLMGSEQGWSVVLKLLQRHFGLVGVVCSLRCTVNKKIILRQYESAAPYQDY